MTLHKCVCLPSVQHVYPPCMTVVTSPKSKFLWSFSGGVYGSHQGEGRLGIWRVIYGDRTFRPMDFFPDTYLCVR